MAGRIVLFGATGYTGRLVAHSLVRRGARPLLAARSEGPLEELAAELGGLETQRADVSEPDSVRALVERGDVLVSTVGPFVRWGEPAIHAAVAAGAHYLDSTGETPFIRDVFQRYGAGAEAAGCGLVTAFGYDWVPGNLAGAMALDDAAGQGEAVTRLDIGYFMTGDASGGMSGGTRASAASVFLEPSHTFRDGQVRTERGAARLRSFEVRGRDRVAVSVGTSEHFALPRLSERLRDVDVYLGWFGPLSRPMQAMSLATSLATKLPGVRSGMSAAVGRFVKGSTGGPDAAQRAKSSSHVVAVASSARGDVLATIHLEGANGYDFTGDILAWGADAALSGLHGAGALGPVDAFGLDRLRAGCAEAGINRV